MNIITEGDMNITAKGQSMDITNTVGGINISSNNNMDITVSNNFSVDSSSFSSTCPITAEVNGVENVYLGCPIGTVVMWVGNTAPDGWFLCNGDRILISRSIPIEQTIQGVDFQEGNLQSLVNILSGEFGAYAIINIHRTNEYIAEATIEGDTITISALTADINLARKFYLNNETTYTIQDEQGTVFTDSEYTKYTVRELPDLQQKFPLGAKQGKTISTYSTNLGYTGGEDMHTLTINEMPSHNHEIFNKDGSGYSGAGFDYLSQTVSPAGWTGGYTENGGGDGDVDWLNTTGGNQSHNNIPPFLAINFIIKYK
jgi:microcystin-dependent protein